MRGFRIYDHTEKVGGRRKERTVESDTPETKRDSAPRQGWKFLHNGEPLLCMVGNNSTFYRLATVNQLRHYLHQISDAVEMYRSSRDTHQACHEHAE